MHVDGKAKRDVHILNAEVLTIYFSSDNHLIYLEAKPVGTFCFIIESLMYC
jgi:hypothetical protein